MGDDLAATLPGKLPGFTGHDGVAAPLCLPHHGEGGVLVGLERFERIGNEEDLHGLCAEGGGPCLAYI